MQNLKRHTRLRFRKQLDSFHSRVQSPSRNLLCSSIGALCYCLDDCQTPAVLYIRVGSSTRRPRFAEFSAFVVDGALQENQLFANISVCDCQGGRQSRTRAGLLQSLNKGRKQRVLSLNAHTLGKWYTCHNPSCVLSQCTAYNTLPIKQYLLARLATDNFVYISDESVLVFILVLVQIFRARISNAIFVDSK